MYGYSRYGYASIERQRQRLPAYKYRNSILYLVETHATTIIVGETGSGKTTQIPQVRSLFQLYFVFLIFSAQRIVQSNDFIFLELDILLCHAKLIRAFIILW